jgi:hypothetical protein
MSSNTSTKELVCGKIPFGQGDVATLVSDQLPLWEATIYVCAWLIEVKSTPDRMVMAARIFFVFMISFGGIVKLESLVKAVVPGINLKGV